MNSTLDLFAIDSDMIKAEAIKAELDNQKPRQYQVLCALGALGSACYHEIHAWLKTKGIDLEKSSLTDPLRKLRERGFVLDPKDGAPVRTCAYTRAKSKRKPKAIAHYVLTVAGMEELHIYLSGTR